MSILKELECVKELIGPKHSAINFVNRAIELVKALEETVNELDSEVKHLQGQIND